MKYIMFLMPMLCFGAVEDDIREYCVVGMRNCEHVMIETQHMSNFYKALGAHDTYEGLIEYIDSK
jgi:hypothetical protein